MLEYDFIEGLPKIETKDVAVLPENPEFTDIIDFLLA